MVKFSSQLHFTALNNFAQLQPEDQNEGEIDKRKIFEPSHEKNKQQNKQLSEFSTRSDTNRTLQSQKQAKSLTFRPTSYEAKTNALISCPVTAQLICIFVFAYADCWFSDAAAHFTLLLLISNYMYNTDF